LETQFHLLKENWPIYILRSGCKADKPHLPPSPLKGSKRQNGGPNDWYLPRRRHSDSVPVGHSRTGRPFVSRAYSHRCRPIYHDLCRAHSVFLMDRPRLGRRRFRLRSLAPYCGVHSLFGP
jgi:hypothetical protein